MIAEKDNPMADLWYGGSGFLPFESAKDKGIITSYTPDAIKDWPEVREGIKIRDKDWKWIGAEVFVLGFVYNTDRVAVMHGGRLVQVDTPTALYSNPGTKFVADFVGSSNIYNGSTKGVNECGETLIQIGANQQLRSTYPTSKKDVEVIIRPESIRLLTGDTAASDENILDGTIELSTYLGPTIRYDVKVGELRFEVDIVFEAGSPILPSGTAVKLQIDPNRVVAL